MQPILAESSQAWQRFEVFLAAGGLFAGDDVVDVADRKPFHLDVPLPGVVESFDAVGSEDQINVERASLDLHEILAAFDLRDLIRR